MINNNIHKSNNYNNKIIVTIKIMTQKQQQEYIYSIVF